eukprot:6179816-Pleurochrysis_carterae.AAC.2
MSECFKTWRLQSVAMDCFSSNVRSTAHNDDRDHAAEDSADQQGKVDSAASVLEEPLYLQGGRRCTQKRSSQNTGSRERSEQSMSLRSAVLGTLALQLDNWAQCARACIGQKLAFSESEDKSKIQHRLDRPTDEKLTKPVRTWDEARSRHIMYGFGCPSTRPLNATSSIALIMAAPAHLVAPKF